MRKLGRLPVREPLAGADYSAVEMAEDNACVWMLEQRALPHEELYLELRSVEEVADGIRDMVVRGAPAIGISAAYGMVLASALAPAASAEFLQAMRAAGDVLRKARPTAVNLAWAVELMLTASEGVAALPAAERTHRLAERARRVHREDVAACREMGRIGAERVPDGATILTHCNAGALATGGYGTALGVIRAARDAGKRVRVIADETRPYLQGIRLTAWELHRDGIDVEVVSDNMAAQLFQRGLVDLVVVGSDRIARNGDVANKIGTYGVACLARMHDRPFYVAAPWSTVDTACPSGAAIPIEERASDELTVIGGQRFAPAGVKARYPAFDVTPAAMVTAIFTERGAISPVSEAAVMALAPSR